jgi:hypothetical protein
MSGEQTARQAGLPRNEVGAVWDSSGQVARDGIRLSAKGWISGVRIESGSGATAPGSQEWGMLNQ